MKKKTSVRLKMIEVGLDLFHQKGIHATSVDEILEKSGTGKSQFYHYFKSKEGLVHEVLRYFYHQLKTDQLPAKTEINTWADLKDWFQTFLDYEKRIRYERSCPMGTIGNDLTNAQELLRQDIRLIFEFTRHCLARFFTSMKAKGELPKSVDPESLADLCFTIQQGGLLISKIERSEATFSRSVELALRLIQSTKT